MCLMDIDLIKGSHLYSADWCLANYPDIASSGLDAAEYYYRFASHTLRDPGLSFSTAWYLSAYPDVAESGQNPLVHYLRIGQFEGCTPLPGRCVDERSGVRGTVEYFNNKLWSGYSEPALRGLKYLATCAETQVRIKALWVLARWHFVQAEYALAAECLETVLSLPGQVIQRHIVALSKCLTFLGQTEALTALLARPRAWERSADYLPYILANALFASPERTAERLSMLNELFIAEGLLSVTLRAPDQPLTITNLGWMVEERCLISEGPLVSVIVPAYNAEATLPIVLRSLIEQTWHNLEVIVVDDCSSDGTARIVTDFMASDGRVRLIRNEENIGAYPSRNAGARTARGDFLTVHDSDDWSHPQKIQLQVAALLSDESKLCSLSSWTRVLPDLRFVGSWFMNARFVERNHSSAMFRRELVEQLGFWDGVNVAADTEFLWRLEKKYGQEVFQEVLPDTPLSFALVLADSLTRATATHVKTIHFGLRRLYREAAAWWHRQEEAPVLRPDTRPFAVPIGNLRGSKTDFDVLVIADYSGETEPVTEILAFLQLLVTETKSLTLFHWPDYRSWHAAPVAPEIFAFCLEHNLQFVHDGLVLRVSKLFFYDGQLWDYPVDAVPQLIGLASLHVVKNGSPEIEQGLFDFFAASPRADAPVSRSEGISESV